MRGRINSADRLQRLSLGTGLLVLNAIGLAESPDWTRWAALALQLELLATAVAGWCPFYWTLGLGGRE